MYGRSAFPVSKVIKQTKQDLFPRDLELSEIYILYKVLFYYFSEAILAIIPNDTLIFTYLLSS